MSQVSAFNTERESKSHSFSSGAGCKRLNPLWFVVSGKIPNAQWNLGTVIAMLLLTII